VRIIDRVANALRAVTSRLIVVSNAEDADTWLPGAQVCRDRRAERGSLVGVHAALIEAADAAFVVAWDMPFVTPALARLVAEHAHGAPFATLPESTRGAVDGLEPMCAVYTRAALPFVEAALDERDFRLSRFIGRLPAVTRVPVDVIRTVGDPERLFFNVNTAEDLTAAERMAERMAG
jgi:molybdopterin-guanine dinucleotide biosynthesis protein A